MRLAIPSRRHSSASAISFERNAIYQVEDSVGITESIPTPLIRLVRALCNVNVIARQDNGQVAPEILEGGLPSGTVAAHRFIEQEKHLYQTKLVSELL